MIVTNNGKIHIKYWLDELPEQGAIDQTENIANFPFAFKHIAIMPDTHQGYGMPIGGVMATKDVIVPNAVGVDIGCGMCAVKTSLTEIDTETLKKIMGAIRKAIPVGMNNHKEAQDSDLMPHELGWSESFPVIGTQYERACKALGTLGGGNHFIEIQKGSDGFIWIMIHSGSRNLGYTVAKHYNDLAKELNKKWSTSVPAEHELAFLPTDSQEGLDYIREMNYCVEFALANRKLMMERVVDTFFKENLISQKEAFFGHKKDMINIAHNYASLEHHFGKNVWVHRKGATRAYKDELGIIPGSQGTKSYIVRGKGVEDSFKSCSHGAGRKMGRKDAQRTLNLKDEIKRLDDAGVIHGIRHEKDLDEATGAYKDIDVVMANQKDLIDIVIELTPLAVIKG